MDNSKAPMRDSYRRKLAADFATRIAGNCARSDLDTVQSAEYLARIAFRLADALLAEGDK